MTTWKTIVVSPVGPLHLFADDDDSLTHLLFKDGRRTRPVAPAARPDPAPFADVVVQLAEYFAGMRKGFYLRIAPVGTDFQLLAWSALRAIPYGETRTYSEQAASIGKPAAFRAVGAANGRNPIGIVVPCHRVVGTDGSLTGYGGGIERKRWLLDHEHGQRESTLFAAGAMATAQHPGGA